MNLMTIMLTSIKAKVTPILTKIRLWLTPSYIKNKLLVNVRTFFLKIFNVQPADEQDYYSILGWFVSKKLALAITIVVCVLCSCFIVHSLPVKGQSNSPYKSYRYNSIPLKLVDDKVQILGKSGYVAYIGDVENGIIKGTGTLYNLNGDIVYEGDFDTNAYNGKGISYFPNTMKQYEGSFKDNLFDGTGKLYRENGVLQYEGEFSQGNMDGAGQLYNAAQEVIYTGQFKKNKILYQELLGKSTTDVAQMYTGKQVVYEGQTTYCVSMEDINAIYYGVDGSNSLEEEFVVSGVYVLEQGIMLEGTWAETIPQLREVLGEPVYEGNTVLSEQDQIPLNILCKNMGRDALYGVANLKTSQIFDDVISVTDFEKEYLIYMYVFEKDDVSYTFYCKDKNASFDYVLLEMK